METIETTRNLEAVKKGRVLTIGNFDGVHLGHQEILTIAKQTAVQKATELIVMTFEPHPLAVLYPQKSASILTPLTLKKHLLTKFNVDCLFILESNLELLSLSPANFVERFLVKNIQPEVVIEGENFNFGSARTGSIHTLKKLGAEKGFEVVEIKSKEVKLSTGQTAKISSTLIRDMLTDGKVADATVALGRPYRLIGKVIPGCGKGKQLGFPTLNLEKPQQIVPMEGVYAGTVELADNLEGVCGAKKRIPAVFSIGRATTYGQGQSLLIEAHLLIDNAEQFTGRWMAMDLIKHLRKQQKFKTETELSAQIEKDCEKTKRILEDIID